MRATVTIDVELCKGCLLCIPVCPPRVLVMSETVNRKGYRYPAAPGRLHRLRALREGVPGLLLRGVPAHRAGEEGCVVSARGPHGRIGGIGRGRGPGRLPLLRRLSDHAVDRDPGVHVDAPARRSAASA